MTARKDKGKSLLTAIAPAILIVALSFICIDNVKILRPDDESLYVQIAREMFA